MRIFFSALKTFKGVFTFYSQAGQGNPVGGKGSQKQAKESETPRYSLSGVPKSKKQNKTNKQTKLDGAWELLWKNRRKDYSS